jgi:hypothetical protein
MSSVPSVATGVVEAIENELGSLAGSYDGGSVNPELEYYDENGVFLSYDPYDLYNLNDIFGGSQYTSSTAVSDVHSDNSSAHSGGV